MSAHVMRWKHTGDALFGADVRLDWDDSSLSILLLPGSCLERFHPTSSDVDSGTILTESSCSHKPKTGSSSSDYMSALDPGEIVMTDQL
jgi:hypothetical protein